MSWRGAVVLLVAIFSPSCGDSGEPHRARLLDGDGRVQLELEIQVADTEHGRAEGLRLHGPLAGEQALLLRFPRDGEVCISNRGVPYPIDLVYLAADQTVTAIERTIPANDPGPYCHPAQLVLELGGGSLGPINYSKLEIF
mgnify:CR=1 FL=1